MTIRLLLRFQQTSPLPKTLVWRAGLEDAITLSDYYDHAFGKSYGVLMREWNLLARVVFVLNADNEITYVEYLDNVNEHPDYDAALEAVK